MNKSASPLTVLAAATAAIFVAAPVQAQNARTWVGSTGSDTNPNCTRALPCLTYLTAFSRTNTGGEINCLDPGDFRPLIISKSISIVCDYTDSNINAAFSSSAFNIDAPAGSIITLKGHNIECGGFTDVVGASGIRIIDAGVILHIQNVQIRNCRNVESGPSSGIHIAPTSGTTEVYVADSYITDNGTGVTTGGILIKPTGSASVKAVLKNINLENNQVGLLADGAGNSGGSIKVDVDDSVISGNTAQGIFADSPTNGAPVDVTITDAAITGNGHAGVLARGKAASGRGSVIVRFGGSNISKNAAGVLAYDAGLVRSLGGNFVDANGSGNGPFTIINPE